jgi:antitoxin component YwqK of YwqJK toxin-antitoxin module
MKKFLLIGIALCISSIVFAQEEGVKIQMVERIPMGDGTMVYRYAEGNKKHLDGECRLAVNEREYIVAVFNDGLPDGKWETYRYSKLYEKRNYKNGKLDGKVITYGTDGKTVIAESTSSNGKRNGRYTSYYSNGKLEKEQEFKDGKENGYLRTYDQDGKIKWDCFYDDGEMQGQQVQLFVSSLDGYYVKTSNYNHGVLVGDYSEIYENGKLRLKGQYDNTGKKTGLWVTGEKDGSITDESEYKNDMLNGKQKSFFVDHTVSKIQTYKDDKLNGITLEYNYKTHNLQSEKNYTDGRLDGLYKMYSDDGKTLQYEILYANGNISRQKNYYPNGKLQSVEEGNKVIEKYDENGKKIN